jgi:nitrogen fixation protein FixH
MPSAMRLRRGEAGLVFRSWSLGADGSRRLPAALENNNMTTASTTKRHLFWPVLITSLICIHIVSVVTMVIVATHDRSFAIEPDYYQKGLHYEQTIEQQRENARLGWSVQLDLSRPLSGSNLRNVTCRIRDRNAKPLADAKVDLVAFAHLRADEKHRYSCVLLPDAPGSYVGTLAFPDPGIWEFRLVVTRGKDTFTSVVKQELESSIVAGD